MSAQTSCGFEILVKLGVRIKKIKNTLLVGFFKNRSKSRKKVKGFPCKIKPDQIYREFSYNFFSKSPKKVKGFPYKMNPDQILREFFYNFFSRSDQFIKDFSCKFEGDQI